MANLLRIWSGARLNLPLSVVALLVLPLLGFSLLPPTVAVAQEMRVQFPAAPTTPTLTTPGGVSTFAPGTPPPVVTTPITPAIPGATWDPYSSGGVAPSAGTPYYAPAQPGMLGPPPGMNMQPPSLFPQGTPFKPEPGYYGFTQSDGTMGQWRRFLTEVRLEHTWIYGPSASVNMQMNVTELSGTFAVPFFYNTESPLLITPGFALNFFDGPDTVYTLQPRAYDGYVDLAWKPHVTQWLSGDVGFRVSASSDFHSLNASAFRYMGRGVGILTFSPNVQVALGVVYLDRQHIKLLPAGGVVWTPSPDLRLDLLFPNPKVAKRLRDFGTTELWGYVAGEYGGGSWNMNTTTVLAPGGTNTNIDYNDIRVSVGLEWTTQANWHGYVEAGYLFERELYVSKADNLSLGETFMVRGGIAF